ncbi:hypothetical protein HY640_05270 [Candidatus Woesearchaeota archaeon]|nr:hypothetical protein [Candidatus Woesearchaeota archaeon]
MKKGKKEGKAAFAARAIIEIAGKPKKHIDDTMKLVIESLKKETGIHLSKHKIHEAEQHEEVYSAFTEVDIELEDTDSLIGFCFQYMPSSIEFSEPEATEVDTAYLTDLFNELLARLHQADQKLKNANAANLILERNADALLKRLLFAVLKQKDKTLEELTQSVGIIPEQLKPFLERYSKEGLIEKRQERYGLKNGQAGTQEQG